jgi:putative Mg2+ transporter-C (MgtC) family protein
MWLTAAIGMACGGGLPLLAVLGTAAYFIVVFAYTPLVSRLPGGATWAQLHIDYIDQRGVLRRALEVCGGAGFTISDLAIVDQSQAGEDTGRDDRRDRSEGAVRTSGTDIVAVTMGVHGSGDLPELVVSLSDLDGVVAVSAGDADAD